MKEQLKFHKGTTAQTNFKTESDLEVKCDFTVENTMWKRHYKQRRKGKEKRARALAYWLLQDLLTLKSLYKGS